MLSRSASKDGAANIARAVHVVAVASLSLALAACSAGGSNGSPSAAGTDPPSTSVTPGPPAADAVHVEDEGSGYEVQALSGPQAADQVTIAATSETRQAPAGEEYVTMTIAVTNPGSSTEPLPIEAACCNSRFQLGTPQDPSADPCTLTLAEGICWIVTEYATVEPAHLDVATPELAAGQTVTIALTTLDPVPTSTDLSSLTLYFTHPIEGTIDPIGVSAA